MCVGTLSGFSPIQKPECCPFELTFAPLPEEKPSTIRIASGSAYGSYWSHANGLRRQFNFSARSDLLSEIEVLETQSPLHNLGEVLAGKAAIGYSNLSMLKAVTLALGQPESPLCLAFPLYETPLSWVIRDNTDIKNLSGLPAGFTLGMGPQFSSTDWYFREILSLLEKDVTASNSSWIALHERFDKQALNGLAYAAGVPNPQIKRLFRKSNPRVLGFSPEEMTLIQDKLHLRPYLILENTYQNQIEPINSAAFWNYAITQCQLNEQSIYEITRLAMEQAQMLPKPSLSALSQEGVKEWIQTGGIPFHPGSIRYFKEKGIEITVKN